MMLLLQYNFRYVRKHMHVHAHTHKHTHTNDNCTYILHIYTHVQAQGSYDTELASLRDTIQSKVVNIFSDSVSILAIHVAVVQYYPQNNAVKRALVESDIIKLCRFFGQQKSK